MKHFLALLLTTALCICTLINTNITAFANETSSDTEQTDSKAASDAEETDSEAASESAPDNWPDYPDINGESAILIEASTGTVLYEKNATQKMYPASITKLLTGIITIENCDLDETVTFSENAVNLVSDASNIECKVGEEMSVEDCLYGLLLASANEVANALAEHIAGSAEDFATMMNEWAAEAGAVNSHFANANGLHDDDHYITAYDMAMITKRAISNPVLCAITGTCEYIIDPTNKTEESRELNNRHKMVWSSEYSSVAYDGVIGGKTGYTGEAGTTLVTYAERDGMTLICVVLNSSGYNVYYDTAALFDYGFDNFNLLNVSDNEIMFAHDSVGITSLNSAFSAAKSLFTISENDYIVLPKTADIEDAEVTVAFDNLDSGTAAILNYTYSGIQIGSASVLSSAYTESTVQTADTESDSASNTLSDSSIAASEEAVAASSAVSLKDNLKSHMSLIIKIFIIIVIIAVLITVIIFIRRKLIEIHDVRNQKCTRYR